MEDESDLQRIVRVVARNWRWILAVTLIAGALAATLTLLSPSKYQATVTVLVTRPLYQYQFSNAIGNTSSAQLSLAGKAALDLATNDSLLQEVMSQVGDKFIDEKYRLDALRKVLTASIGGDPSIIKLSAKNGTAEGAARLVNTWAEDYVRQVNDLYGRSGDQFTFFEEQANQAKTDLEAAEKALIDYQRRSDLSVLQAQLAAKQSALQDYLRMNESLVRLRRNVGDLQDQLARLPADTRSNLGDQLSQIMLQVSVFAAESTALPIQLQMPAPGGSADMTVGQQAAYLAGLETAIEAKQAEVKQQVETLPAEIKALQGEVQETSTESARLTRDRDLAQSVYTTLALKVEETRISGQEGSGSVRMVGVAPIPERPASKKLLTKSAIGLIFGFLVAAGAAFAIEYFRGAAPTPTDLSSERHPSRLNDAAQ